MSAPALINQYSATGANTLTLTVANVVVPNGTNKPMIVVCANSPTNAAMNAASWNAQSFTLVPGSNNNFWSAAAYLIPSAFGTHDVTITYPFFGNTGLVVTVFVLSDAVGIGATASGGGTATSTSGTLSTTLDDSMVVDYTMNDGTLAHTQGAGQTLILSTANGAYRSSCSYKTVAAALTSTTMSVSAGSSCNWQLNMLEITSTVPFAPQILII